MEISQNGLKDELVGKTTSFVDRAFRRHTNTKIFFVANLDEKKLPPLELLKALQRQI